MVSVIIALNAGARWLRSLLNYRLRSANNAPLSTPPTPPSPSLCLAPAQPRSASILFPRMRRDRESRLLPFSFSFFSPFSLTRYTRCTFFSLHPRTESASYLMGHGLNYDRAPLSLVVSSLLRGLLSPEILFLFRLFAEYIARDPSLDYTIPRL